MLSRNFRETVIAWKKLKESESVHCYAESLTSKKFLSKISNAGIEPEELDLSKVKAELHASDLSESKLKLAVHQAHNDIEKVFSFREKRKSDIAQLQDKATALKSKLSISNKHFKVEKDIDRKESRCNYLRRKIEAGRGDAFRQFSIFLLSIVFWGLLSQALFYPLSF